MFNYVAAELYKLCHKRAILWGMLLLVAVESLFFVPVFADGASFVRGVYLDFFSIAICTGLLISPVFAAGVFDNQGSNGTLKNEIVYGISRSRIYLGKLLAGAVAGTICSTVVVGWALLMICLTGTESPATWVRWVWVGISLGSNWCMWLAVYAYTFFLLMTVKSTIGALLIGYLTTILGGIASTAVAGADAALWKSFLAELFYAYPLVLLMGRRVQGALLGVAGIDMQTLYYPLIWAVLTGGLWIGGSAALGLFLFRRKEIK